MNPALAMHTAARRYCLERRDYWSGRYSDLARAGGDRTGAGEYTREALATFPRYNVLNAVRVEVERIDPVGLDSLEATRSLLVLAGEVAEDVFTRGPNGEIEQRAMDEERQDYCRYIIGLTPADLNAVQPLPYRRVLACEESKALWSRLRARWRIPPDHWYPLAECSLPGLVAFEAAAFHEAVPNHRLQAALASCGVGRVWELREYGPEYEEDVALFDPFYNGAEGYWSSGDMDWILYASHEGSITVAGRLLQGVQEIWPSWHASPWVPVPPC